jgi:hypothetical protein
VNLIYIINAHQHPCQVARMIDRLRTPWSYFYIQVDCPPETFTEWKSILAKQEQVHLQRIQSKWGGIEFVHMVLDALEAVARDHRDGTVILLSGQDYPIKPAASIQQFLEEHPDTTFMECEPYLHGVREKSELDPDEVLVRRKVDGYKKSPAANRRA